MANELKRPGPSTVVSVILGAVISLISSVAVTSVQAHYQAANQRKEFLYENRLTAIKEFAATIRNDADLLEKYDECERDLNSLIHRRSKPSEFSKFRSLFIALDASYGQYEAALRTQAVVMNSLLDTSFSLPPVLKISKPIELPDDDDLSDLSKPYLMDEFQADLKNLREDLHAEHAHIVEAMNSYEKYLELLAQSIRDHPPK